MVEIIIKNCINYNVKITNNTIIVSDKENKNFMIDFKDGTTNNTNEKKISREWEEETNLDIGRTDDFEKMPKTKSIDEVKKRCIELGSHLFVAKTNNQYYIRSPPNRKQNRDYNSIKQKAEQLRKEGKISLGWTSYILKPIM